MRCPKCQYLGFEGQSRCRNCGYDLSLSSTLPTADPPIALEAGRPDPASTEDSPAPDLPLRSEPSARERAREAIRQRAAVVRTPAEPFDLPLFAGAAEPRMPAPSPTPRPPLAVRRPTIEPPRSRAGTAAAPAPVDPAPEPPASEPDASRDVSPDLSIVASDRGPAVDPPLAIEPVPEIVRPPVAAQSSPLPLSLDVDLARRVPGALADAGSDAALPTEHASLSLESEASPRLASIGSRVLGGLVDLTILGVVDLVVLAFTLRLTDVPWSQIERLPPAPLAAFLALLATGYLSMFTLLAGQTAGHMLAGIRVVETGGSPVRFGHAVLRAVVQVVTVPLLGIGFLPALLGADRRALYDRLSDTEVVRSDT